MARVLWVIPPENVPLEFELAGLGSRCGAQLLDLLAQGLLVLTLWLLGLLAGAALPALAPLLEPAVTVGTFLIFVGYSIAFETLANGQTPGKRALGLRVLTDQGFPVTFIPAAIRNLVRLADFLPVGYGVGVVCAFIHPQVKRLGDVVAGTVVVKECRQETAGEAVSPTPYPAHLPDPCAFLAPDEIALLQRLAHRRRLLRPDDAERQAYRLLAPRLERLGWALPADQPPRYAELLATLAWEIERRRLH